MSLKFSAILVTLSLAAAPCAAADNPSRSGELAKQLAAALTAQKIDAVAARDPHEPDRFVAALYYPGAQLLVVSARHPVPAAIDAKLAQKQYRDVYLDLQGSPVANTNVFFQDMKADGLCASRDQEPDILFKGSGAPQVFDVDAGKHDMSQKAYEAAFTAADQQYSEMLSTLIAQLKPAN